MNTIIYPDSDIDTPSDTDTLSDTDTTDTLTNILPYLTFYNLLPFTDPWDINTPYQYIRPYIDMSQFNEVELPIGTPSRITLRPDLRLLKLQKRHKNPLLI